MAVETYSRVFNFQNQQALTPAAPIPAQSLDAELNAVKIVFDNLISALAEIQRDDFAVANATIGYDQLKPELSAGFAPPHVWTTSTAYTTADAVFHDTAFYRCLVKHTAGVFATDLAANKWQLVYDFAEIFAQLADDIGLDGWSPEFAVESDGEKRVLKIVDWTGGDGEKPAVDKYVGATGLVDAIGDGVDVRGPEGVQGDTGDTVEWHTGSTDPAGGLGENGDFYLQTGTGDTGAIGDVWQKAAGSWSNTGGNIRGPAGTGDVSTDGSVAAGNLAAFIDGSTIEDSGYAPSDFAAAGHDHDSDYAALSHNHDATYQPLDADLTSIASLSTTSFGRGLLESADAATLFAALKQAASDSATGVVELAIASEVNTGTDTARAITPDALAGSNYGTFIVTVEVFSADEDVETGDGAGDVFWRVPSILNGWNLVAVAAAHHTAGTGAGSDTTDIQIHNVTQAADMLSTKITIDEDETDSKDAAAAVIDTGNDDVATGDILRFDVDDLVSGTAPKGLVVELQFRLP